MNQITTLKFSLTFETELPRQDDEHVKLAHDSVKDAIVAYAKGVEAGTKDIMDDCSIGAKRNTIRVNSSPSMAVIENALTHSTVATSAVVPATPSTVLEEPLSAEDREKYMVAVFKDLKRTEKSELIIGALLDTTDAVSIKDLAEALQKNYNDIASWFNVTGKLIPAIVKTGKALYKFDRTKVQI
jgi:hypothetical protein